MFYIQYNLQAKTHETNYIWTSSWLNYMNGQWNCILLCNSYCVYQ